jgi:LSM domain
MYVNSISTLQNGYFIEANCGLAQVFLNIVLDDAVEEKDGGEKVRIGTVVIRGNSVVMLEVYLNSPPERLFSITRIVLIDPVTRHWNE